MFIYRLTVARWDQIIRSYALILKDYEEFQIRKILYQE